MVYLISHSCDKILWLNLKTFALVLCSSCNVTTCVALVYIGWLHTALGRLLAAHKTTSIPPPTVYICCIRQCGPMCHDNNTILTYCPDLSISQSIENSSNCFDHHLIWGFAALCYSKMSCFANYWHFKDLTQINQWWRLSVSPCISKCNLSSMVFQGAIVKKFGLKH